MVFEKIETDVWKPENTNDEIIGVLIKSDDKVGANQSMLYNLEVDTKPVSVWGSTVLDQKMMAIKPGDKIKIVYLGKGAASFGKNPPKLFDVYIDKEEAVDNTSN